MASANISGCINHPGVEAVVRCKQCGKAVCRACMVSGPTGRFCSMECKEKHQVFAQRAQQLDTKPRGTFFVKLRNTMGSIIIMLGVLIMIGVVAATIELPILSDLVRAIREQIGI